jgi:hypothetical protein
MMSVNAPALTPSAAVSRPSRLARGLHAVNQRQRGLDDAVVGGVAAEQLVLAGRHVRAAVKIAAREALEQGRLAGAGGAAQEHQRVTAREHVVPLLAQAALLVLAPVELLRDG